jgi:hypothetical protein
VPYAWHLLLRYFPPTPRFLSIFRYSWWEATYTEPRWWENRSVKVVSETCCSKMPSVAYYTGSSTGVEIFQKSRRHIKILGANRLTCNKFHTKIRKYQVPPSKNKSPRRPGARNLCVHALLRRSLLSTYHTVSAYKSERQFSRQLAAEVCASAVVMLDTLSSEVVWRVLLTTPFTSFPFTSPPVRHRVPSRFNWTLQKVWQNVWNQTGEQ